MLRIRCNLNYGHVTLDSNTHNHHVPIMRKDGDREFVRWEGFIELEQARFWRDARPVKIAIDFFALSGSDNWIRMEPGEFLQGCLTTGPAPWDAMVFGVMVDGAPRLVSHPTDTILPWRHRTGGRNYS